MASPQREPIDEVLAQQSPAKKVKPENLEAERRDLPEPMVVVDPEVEARKKAQATLRSQIADLEKHEEDLRARYAASKASFETHQAEKAQRQADLGELRRTLVEQKEALTPLLQKKEEWIGKVGNAYGSLGVALLNRDQTVPDQQQALSSAMQEIYDAPNLDSQEGPRQRIQDILAGPNRGLKKPCPLPDLFYRMEILRRHWESMQGGAPAFSTTLQTPAVQEKYKIVAGVLSKVVEFNRVLVEHLDPSHLDFHKITAKSSAVAVALAENNDVDLAENNDVDLRKFLQKDGFEERKKTLQAKNYSGLLTRITEGLKAVALELAGAKVRNDQDAIRKAMATLTSAGLPGDIAKWTSDAVEEAIDSQSEAAIAQISLESFKETTLPQIYGPAMDSLSAQWATEQEKRQTWLDQVRETLLEDEEEIRTLQGRISDLEGQEPELQKALSGLDRTLAQESQELKRLGEESQALDAQLQSLRQQQA
jgi:chromosome segregation ATPase